MSIINNKTMPSELLAKNGNIEKVIEMNTTTTTTKIFNQEALDLLLKRTGYPLVQENGQRRYGPPPDWNSSNQTEPDRSCEVFVGKLPRDCFEYEIIPILERVGYIYEFRLMMEYSGYNRGYGFVMYTCREDAKKAVLMLNNYEIRKGRMIGLCRSVDNCRLFVGGIPKTKKREEILDEMKKVTDDVINVIVYPSANDKTKNRGFAFVQYASHRAAAVARRKLIPNRISLFGQPIAVDWAEPEPEVDEDVMASVKVLYVRNLMLTTTEDKIRTEFEKIKEGSVERVKKMKDFAFVHFKEREDALNAMKIMNGSTIDDAFIEVTLSKPVDKTKLLQANQLQQNPLLVSDADLNLLLSTGTTILNAANVTSAAAAGAGHPSHMIHTSSNQLINIPITFTDPNTNLQFHLANQQQQQHHLASMPLNGLTSIPNFNQFNTTILTAQNQFIPIYNTNIPTDLNGLIPTAAAAATYHQQTSKPSSILNRSLLKAGSTARTTSGPHRYSAKLVYQQNGSNLINPNLRKHGNNDDLLYDYYSGIKQVPILPFKTKTSVEILEEMCLKEGIPQPIYTLHTTSGQCDGKEIGLFMYKVMLPNIFNTSQLSSNRLMRTIEEAKNDAADFVLMQIYSNQAQQATMNENFNYENIIQPMPLTNNTTPTALNGQYQDLINQSIQPYILDQ